MAKTKTPWVFITGAARRLGRELACALHEAGFNVLIHYHQSATAAKALQEKLNTNRINSCALIQANFNNEKSLAKMLQHLQQYKQLKVLINNASVFKPTRINRHQMQDWDHIFNTNAKAAFFISQAVAKNLSRNQGVIINMTDIHGIKPFKNYPLYSTAKASLIMLTQALAKELAPKVRVNAIALSTVMWPEGENALTPIAKKNLQKTFLTGTKGEPHHIIKTVFYILENTFMTGEILRVDGGRYLS